jgi:hypothetical protein
LSITLICGSPFSRVRFFGASASPWAAAVEISIPKTDKEHTAERRKDFMAVVALAKQYTFDLAMNSLRT